MAGCYEGCLANETCLTERTAEFECLIADDMSLVCDELGVYIQPDHCVPEQTAATECKYATEPSALRSTKDRRVRVP
jgi:hypothetical protein